LEKATALVRRGIQTTFELSPKTKRKGETATLPLGARNDPPPSLRTPFLDEVKRECLLFSCHCEEP